MVDQIKLQRACRLSTKAVECDHEGNLTEALELYQRCVISWEDLAASESNPRNLTLIRIKIDEFNNRAECIQKFLASQRPSSSNSSISANENVRIENAVIYSPPIKDPLEHFKQQLRALVSTQVPTITFDDVAGLKAAKQTIQECTILPKKFPNLFHGRSWNAILLYGPPGTGKTLLAKATANAAKDHFVSVSSADLLSKWQGESEKYIRALFEVAREIAPSVIFIDEIDSLCCNRGATDTESTRRIKTEFLIQMNQLSPKDGTVVLGATNTPWDLDLAVLRRFQRRIYVGLPDWESRRKVFELGLRNATHNLTSKEIDRLAELTNGYTASDIAIVIQDALLEPLRNLERFTWFKPIIVNGKDMFMPVREEESKGHTTTSDVSIYSLHFWRRRLGSPFIT
eukprot:Gregarina_sp_Pseudo_9__5163@NODE_552_length_2595_cov_40_772300_g521_i0_p1_GENE_NODE_552_length_2595_cov_40_772300_g521_i0NODE_552_length_2595_cov_40_772300_g521_i0_p1_ORF_typecomplete_len400_score24_64AAA/PF00004_29/7_7e40MIT/PF04212_18/1_9e11RuvB_N/PF05496_12/8_1e11Bac_DnaA/PF00308_18/1e03Bac_DnaA/PF00308_18/3_7e08AAA_5/PF07728_14/6_5e08DUF815/PF05673_13/2_3e07AAA_2/PF07724_14/4_7e07IstB_IS21/PF01695_17/1_7e06AAA_22/PF13401_6/1_9e05AAA_16/PF13191_6/2_2e05AAA_14/PF13173_6/2_7e03AAA_14/PF13173_6/